MQCFSPCFAPEARRELIASDKNVSVGYHATDSTAGRWREPEVHVHLHSNTSSTLAAGSQKAAIKAALNAGSSSTTSSSTSQQAAAGTPCPALSTDGPAREQLRQEFLMQHGRNIMAVSTLQQEGLKYFVIPGKQSGHPAPTRPLGCQKTAAAAAAAAAPQGAQPLMLRQS